jgi:hypothetical protein
MIKDGEITEVVVEDATYEGRPGARVTIFYFYFDEMLYWAGLWIRIDSMRSGSSI